MATFLLLVPLFALQAPADPEPESWPWDAVFEWEIKYWEWLGEGGEKANDIPKQIPKNAQMVAGVRLYEKFGRRAYACVDVGNEGRLRVALDPQDLVRSLGLLTTVRVAIFRPLPQNGASHGWMHLTGCEVATKKWKFGEPMVVGGTSYRAGGMKRSFHAFTLTIRKREQDRKGLIKGYFEDQSSPEYQDELKRLQTLPGGSAGSPGK